MNELALNKNNYLVILFDVRIGDGQPKTFFCRCLFILDIIYYDKIIAFCYSRTKLYSNYEEFNNEV